MRGAWAAFAKDPYNGSSSYGWPKYSAQQSTLIRLAYRNQTGPNSGVGEEFDGKCRAFSAADGSATASSTSATRDPSSLSTSPVPEVALTSTSVVYTTPSAPAIATSSAASNYASRPRPCLDMTFVLTGLVLLLVLCMNLIQGAFFLVLLRFLWLRSV